MGERADPMSSPHARSDEESASASDPAMIEAEIETTREEMSETIEAIQDRLAPEHLAEQAADAVRELAGQATTAVGEMTADKAQQMARQTRETAPRVRGGLWSTITHNPVPAALIAIGVGWLWKRQSGSATSSDYASYDAYGVERESQDRYSGRAQGLWQKLETNPLALGALSLVLGAITGLVVPETEKEHQLMGETRDRTVGRAQERLLGSVQEQVQAVAEQAIQTVTDTAQDVLPTRGTTSEESA
jgi:hypothetical protein